jgi:hypothetical protein
MTTASETLEKSALGSAQPLDEKLSNGGDQPSSMTDDEAAGQIESLAALSPSEDRALTLKIDLKVIPIMGMIYLICFLDRTNIANARLAGLEAGLSMPSTGYNTALWIFYIPFVLFEVPSNYLLGLHWIRPNLFLGAQMFILG